mgnify:CR=1 FL=1
MARTPQEVFAHHAEVQDHDVHRQPGRRLAQPVVHDRVAGEPQGGVVAGREQLTQSEHELPIIDLADRLGDFYSPAAIVSNLDLVISSDCATVHLAGALGVPVWVAMAWAPDWRWLLEREDCPWYPTMRLFRQSSLGDWPGVFRRIQAALLERVGK